MMCYVCLISHVSHGSAVRRVGTETSHHGTWAGQHTVRPYALETGQHHPTAPNRMAHGTNRTWCVMSVRLSRHLTSCVVWCSAAQRSGVFVSFRLIPCTLCGCLVLSCLGGSCLPPASLLSRFTRHVWCWVLGCLRTSRGRW